MPSPAHDRAGLRRYRNIIADLGCDFDVAGARDRVRGFVHITYARDLHSGNRGQLLALVSDAADVRDALLAAALARATRRRCSDLTVSPGPWTAAFETAGSLTRWQRLDGCFRIDLAGQRGAECSESPVENR